MMEKDQQTVTILYSRARPKSTTDAEKTICPMLSGPSPSGCLREVSCMGSTCNLWRVVVGPPGDKNGACFGYCTIPVLLHERLKKVFSAAA